MLLRNLLILAVISLLVACGTPPVKPAASSKKTTTPKTLPTVNPQPDPTSQTKAGGYYLDDGPGTAIDLSRIPELTPIDEPEHPRANNSYLVEGELVTPERGRYAYSAEGGASWYGKRFHGRKTSSGEKYDMYAFSAAHRTLPIPSYARVTNLKNGNSVIVRVNDRGPFHKKRLIDLSYAAAAKLDFIKSGHTQVKIERVFPDSVPDDDDNARTTQQTSPLLSHSTTIQLDANKVYWQLGVFKQNASAQTLAEKMRSKLNGKEILVLPAGIYKRVLAGPYDDESAARDDYSPIENALGKPPMLYRPTLASNP